MESALFSVPLRDDVDLVLAREVTRRIAAAAGLDGEGQSGTARAVEQLLASNRDPSIRGEAAFFLDEMPHPTLRVRLRGLLPFPGDARDLLDGGRVPQPGRETALVQARRLVHRMGISPTREGTMLELHQPVPAGTLPDRAHVQRVAARALDELTEPSALTALLRRELARVREDLREQEAEVERLTRELEDTNRGVMALYVELEEKADTLRRASELKSRFLANMSHEFRTPLSSILSLSRLLLDRADGELTPEQERQATYIRMSAEALSELVNDLLDLAQIEAGKTVVRPTEFEVEDLFGALRGMIRPLVASDRVRLSFEPASNLPSLFTDEGKVAQILRNFISNALKFTEEGEVRVSAAGAPDGASVIFSVSDTGIGIAPEDQERIFDEFTQVESPMQRRVKGTGLGLPLCRKLAELLGGSVTVESARGVGSTFSATIPRVYLGPATGDAVIEVPTRPDPTRLPVLVVEDDPDTLYIYERYFKGSGFQVIPARTVMEARARLREIRPVAAVLDIVLESETTWSFLSEMKQNEATRDIPIVVLTVVDGQQTAMALGADEFCMKPVERRWLLSRLTEMARHQPVEKLLVIDDDPVSRYLLRALLSDTRYSIVEATTGRDGVEKARVERPQVIFLDLLLPDTTAFEVLEQLKAGPETAEIPVIINAERRLDEEERRRLEPGTAAILAKDSPDRETAILMLREAVASARSRSGPRPVNEA